MTWSSFVVFILLFLGGAVGWGGGTENVSVAVGVLIKVDLFCRAPHSHTTMSCVSAVHQSPRLSASRRVSMNSKALSAPPGNKNGTICLRCITPCHEGIPCAIALSPRRPPSHYFTLKYIAVFCIADTALRGRRSGLTGSASVCWGWRGAAMLHGSHKEPFSYFCFPALLSKTPAAFLWLRLTLFCSQRLGH